MCRRAVRGMIGWKGSRGREAFKNVRCYEGVPQDYESAEKMTFKKAKPGMTLARLSQLVRQKIE